MPHAIKNVVGVEQVRFRGTLDLDSVRADKARYATKQIDIIAAKLVPDDPGFALDHLSHARAQVANGNSVFYNIIAAVKGAVAESGQVKNRFAQGLAGDGAPMDADSSDHLIPVHHGHALTELRSGDCTFLPGRAASNNDQVVPDWLH